MWANWTGMMKEFEYLHLYTRVFQTADISQTRGSMEKFLEQKNNWKKKYDRNGEHWSIFPICFLNISKIVIN